MRCKMIYVNEINGAAILGGGIVFWMTDATKGHGITSEERSSRIRIIPVSKVSSH